MASRFWVGGTASWDATAGSKWATTSGGAGGASVPGSSDAVVFDNGAGASGTVTVNTTVTVQSISMAAFVGTVDFATNNNNVTLSTNSALIFSGTSARTLNMGSGTWTFTAASGTIMDFTTMTSGTANTSSANIVLTNTTPSGRRSVILNGQTFASVTVNATTANGYPVYFNLAGSVTFTTLSIVGPANILVTNGTTLTVTNAPTFTGGSISTPIFISSNFASFSDAQATISCGGAPAISYVALNCIVFSGTAGAATNSFDLGRNSGITITAPSVGGSSGKFIGG